MAKARRRGKAGIRTQFTHHGFKARTGTNSVDNAHTWIDPILVAGPWLLGSALLVKAGRRLSRLGRLT